LESVAFGDLAQQLDELTIVAIVEKDRHAPVAAGHDVAENVGGLNPSRASHGWVEVKTRASAATSASSTILAAGLEKVRSLYTLAAPQDRKACDLL
jgi:hypothetical protein